MLSWIKHGQDELRGLVILSNINAKNIQNHALQEVKNEESQLKHLAVATPERAKTDLRWHLDLTGDSFD
jgi:hypothetical protein